MTSLVYLRNKTNDRVYVYVNEKVTNKDGKSTYRRRCIGHLDEETGDIIPNTHRSQSPSADIEYIGMSRTIRELSDRIGLSEVLKITFGSKWKKILTCAMYGLTGNTDLSSIEKWSSRFRTPNESVITSDEILDLLNEMDHEDIDVFQRIWRKRVKDREIYHISASPLISYDPRNFSSYGMMGVIPNMDMDICYGIDTQLPISYDLLPGRVFALEDIIDSEDRYQWINPSTIQYILNEEYCEGYNVDVLVVSDRRFMIRMPADHRISKRIMDDLQDEIMTYSNYRHSGGGYNFIKTHITEIAGKPCYAHMYYSAEAAEKEMGTFLSIIEKCRTELSSNRPVSAHTELYGKYFDMKGPDMEVELNGTGIMEKTKYAGITVILSDTIVDPIRVMDCFNLNSFVERTFDNLQNTADHLKLKLYLKHNLASRYFIQFITLILKSAIRKALIDNNLYRDHTAEDVVREISNIAVVKVSDRKRPLEINLNYRQKMFMEILDPNMTRY